MSKPKQKFDITNEYDNDKVKEICKRKRFHPHDLCTLKPLTDAQTGFFVAYNTETPLILLDGVAGTGKSIIAFYAALHDVLSPEHPQEKVLVVRSAVESGQGQGFLPGSLSEKSEPYEAPYRSIAKTIIPSYNEPYKHLKSLGYVDFMTTTYIRGLTLDNTIIIIEEVQNMDYDEIRSIISRAGHSTRVILTGDFAQNDLSRKRKTSGLGQLKKVMLNMSGDMAQTVTFGIDDIVRGGLCGAFLRSDAEVGE